MNRNRLLNMLKKSWHDTPNQSKKLKAYYQNTGLFAWNSFILAVQKV